MIVLRNADCRSEIQNLPTESVDLVIADPPWGGSNNDWDIRVHGWVQLLERVLKPTGSLWVVTNLPYFYEILSEELNKHGYVYIQDVIIERPNGNGVSYRPHFRKVHHMAIQFRRKTQRILDVYLDKPISESGKLLRSVLPDTDPKRRWHPAQQPLEITRSIIRNSCPKGGMILDPFAGSGTVAIAAYQEGRDCFSIEKDYLLFQDMRQRLDLTHIPFDTTIKENYYGHVEAQQPARNPSSQSGIDGLGSTVPDVLRLQRRSGIRGRLRRGS